MWHFISPSCLGNSWRAQILAKCWLQQLSNSSPAPTLRPAAIYTEELLKVSQRCDRVGSHSVGVIASGPHERVISGRRCKEGSVSNEGLILEVALHLKLGQHGDDWVDDSRRQG